MAKVENKKIIDMMTLEEGNEILENSINKGRKRKFKGSFKKAAKGRIAGLYRTGLKSDFKCKHCGERFTHWALIYRAKTHLIRLVRKTGINKKGEEIYTYATIDHIIPRIKGGENYIWNRDLLCTECNSAKGDKMPPLEKQLIVQIDKILYEMEINKNRR